MNDEKYKQVPASSGFIVYKINEDGSREYLGVLDKIESVEALGEDTEDQDEKSMGVLLRVPDEVTFTAKLTLWTMVRLWFWRKKLEVQKRLTLRRIGKLYKKMRRLEKAQMTEAAKHIYAAREHMNVALNNS